jgi:hypothetical protein
VQAAAQFALDLQSRGLPGTWSVRLDTEAQFRWDRSTLPIARELTVSSDGMSAGIRLRSGESSLHREFSRSNGGWNGENDAVLPQVKTKDHSKTVMMPWALTCATNDDIRPKLKNDSCGGEIVSALR